MACIKDKADSSQSQSKTSYTPETKHIALAMSKFIMTYSIQIYKYICTVIIQIYKYISMLIHYKHTNAYKHWLSGKNFKRWSHTRV